LTNGVFSWKNGENPWDCGFSVVLVCFLDGLKITSIFFDDINLIRGFKHFLFSIIYGMIYQDNLHIFTGGFLILSSHVSFFRS
jgi:hypothetical protein